MVVLIVAMVMVASILKARYNTRRFDQGELDTGTSKGVDAARLRDEVRTLKERIAVLERIATDRTNSLDHDIEQLRDR
jgi:hypothetical protein